jgi:hypothetical protein
LLDRAAAAGPILIDVRGASVRIDAGARGATLDPPGPGAWRYSGLHVVDGSGRPLPARFAPAPGGLRLVLDPSDAALAPLPIRIDPILTAAVWMIEGNQVGALLGSSVAGVGDVNGDGFDDVAISGPGTDGPQGPATGAVSVYLGSSLGLGFGPDVVLDGGPLEMDLEVVTGAGDVNDDGYADLLAGSPACDAGGGGAGAASLYLGGPLGLASTPSWTVQGNQAAAQVGWDVSTAGDVDGDGDAEILVGAPGYSRGQLREGVAMVFLGSTQGPSGGAPLVFVEDADWIGEADQGEAFFGQTVAAAWDVNGDGYGDVVVGAPYWDGALAPNDGRVFLYAGSAAGLRSAPLWSATGLTTGVHLGEEVAGAGDVNGDGFSDLAFGMPAWSLPGPSAGRVQVYYGALSGPAALPDWTLEGANAGDNFGYRLSPAGDADGDGFADLLATGGASPTVNPTRAASGSCPADPRASPRSPCGWVKGTRTAPSTAWASPGRATSTGMATPTGSWARRNSPRPTPRKGWWSCTSARVAPRRRRGRSSAA